MVSRVFVVLILKLFSYLLFNLLSCSSVDVVHVGLSFSKVHWCWCAVTASAVKKTGIVLEKTWFSCVCNLGIFAVASDK